MLVMADKSVTDRLRPDLLKALDGRAEITVAIPGMLEVRFWPSRLENIFSSFLKIPSHFDKPQMYVPISLFYATSFWGSCPSVFRLVILYSFKDNSRMIKGMCWYYQHEGKSSKASQGLVWIGLWTAFLRTTTLRGSSSLLFGKKGEQVEGGELLLAEIWFNSCEHQKTQIGLRISCIIWWTPVEHRHRYETIENKSLKFWRAQIWSLHLKASLNLGVSVMEINSRQALNTCSPNFGSFLLDILFLIIKLLWLYMLFSEFFAAGQIVHALISENI